MARIARRGLQLRNLPLFSLAEPVPWQSQAAADGTAAFRLKEPSHLELARRVLPPNGDGKFGFVEGASKAGGPGIIAQVQDFQWSADKSTVAVRSRGSRRFRILGCKEHEIETGQPPLLLAKVQLLADQDLMRGPAIEGLNFWMAKDESGSKASQLKAGDCLVAVQGVPVFESMESWTATHSIAKGVMVVADGPPRFVQGYLMVPIVPSGAVELTMFRRTGANHAMASTSETDLKAALKSFDTNFGNGGRK